MEQRTDPKRILDAIRREEDVENSGKLKIFFGYAAGVGKTYAMLEAAHEAKRAGRDVVVGYVERHSRPDTLALLDGLEQLPCKTVSYKGVDLREFDLDAALARRPQLILVDELAHTNAPGCRHAKRYQDVEELLRAGIDVYSTVNVQHLESLNDLVASITGVAVSERIPDRVFDSAAQVELVDIEPEDLIARLEGGKVYRKDQAKRALDHFFSHGNLAALREIALRRTADRLNRTAQQEGDGTVARAGEHILVCLSGAPSNARVIRTAARMAEAFHSGFTALLVQTSEARELKGEAFKRLQNNVRLAEQLGAQVATVYGEDAAAQIAEYAKVSGVTKIVLGRTNHRRIFFFGGTSLADRLADLASSIDIYIIPDTQPIYRKKPALFRPVRPEFHPLDLIKAVGLTVLATALSELFYRLGLREANIIMVYILSVLTTAVWTHGYLYGAIASLLSVLAFNFFFTDPRLSIAVADASYPITFVIMLVASVMASTLANRVKKQARQSAQKAYYTDILLTSSQKIQQGRDEKDILRTAAAQVSKLLNRPILFAVTGLDTKFEFDAISAEHPETAKTLLESLTSEELGVAEWVVKNNKRAGATTRTLSDAKNLYFSVRGIQGPMGIVGVPIRHYPDLEVFEKNLMIAILNESGIILERRRLRQEKQNSEMETRQERLRANLLRAISHDLRTPLTSISGNAGVLMEKGITLDEAKKQELYHAIYDDAMWLVNLTENLLSITRIENGTLSLHTEAQLLDDVFQEALKHIDRRAQEHRISVELPDDLIMARMDVQLIIQVIINIVNNAIKYTPPGSHIVLRAEKDGSMARVSISDDGPGISDEAKAHLFDLFSTANKKRGDDRRGMGLGLNLCRSIVTAHGGEIRVYDNVPRGSVFTFTLPLEEVKIFNA